MTQAIERSVHIHAFKHEPDCQTHCDRDDPALAGWSVYLREQRGDDVDLPVDEDFTDELIAVKFAEELAAKHGCTVEDY